MRFTPIGIALALASMACGGDQGATNQPQVASGSFAQLQTSVLTPNCAVSACHVSASAAASGNLVLSPDAAYDNLVSAAPSNLAAQRDGLKRVTPFKPDSSLLFQKIVLALAAHGGNYGNVMPVGAQALPQGQSRLHPQMDRAGARGPATLPTQRCSPTRRRSPRPCSCLVAPAQDEIQDARRGIARHHFERELFVYRSLGNAADIYVNRIQTSMRALSHHFVLYSIDPSIAPGWPCVPATNVVRDIRNADGSMNLLNMIPMACHVFVAGSMTQTSDYVFPAGVALRLPASMSIDMNVHYVNRTTSEVPGEAYANLYTIPLSQVQKVAHTLNMSNTSFSLPAGKETTVEKTFTVSQPTTVFMLTTSHMHMLGKRFQIKIVGGARDGELVYESTDWEHPQTLTFPTPIVLQPGQGLKSVITWNNTTNHVVSFGLQSTDEMGIIFGYYY
jgi:hypothetical protein